MYIPPRFREDDLGVLHAMVHHARLGVLVSSGPAGLIASHVPMLLDPDAGPYGMLTCHLARANAQSRDLRHEGEVMIVFRAEDAYVSPSWYATKSETGKVVPTWLYVAVHAYGRPRVIDDPDALRTIVTRLTEKHEAPRRDPWAVTDAPEAYITALLGGIVGVEIPIERLEGKWKLDQDASDADVRGAIDELRSSEDYRDRETAEAMDRRRKA
ncbi:MAG: FMN-binding negative transcriptional regulator [Candidatus Eremiobacteraeota bacterium]|nr:FMN-binding negative transcriptional regulator [Candidatus Eremiobacteraeota bacterium]